MTKITAPIGHAPALQPTPALVGAPWRCWRSVCPASAATPLPGCVLHYASASMTEQHGLAAGAATPTQCAAKFLPPTPTPVIHRYEAKTWKSLYDTFRVGGENQTPKNIDIVIHLPTNTNLTNPTSSVVLLKYFEFRSPTQGDQRPTVPVHVGDLMPENKSSTFNPDSQTRTTCLCLLSYLSVIKSIYLLLNLLPPHPLQKVLAQRRVTDPRRCVQSSANRSSVLQKQNFRASTETNHEVMF